MPRLPLVHKARGHGFLEFQQQVRPRPHYAIRYAGPHADWVCPYNSKHKYPRSTPPAVLYRHLNACRTYAFFHGWVSYNKLKLCKFNMNHHIERGEEQNHYRICLDRHNQGPPQPPLISGERSLCVNGLDERPFLVNGVWKVMAQPYNYDEYLVYTFGRKNAHKAHGRMPQDPAAAPKFYRMPVNVTDFLSLI